MCTVSTNRISFSYFICTAYGSVKSHSPLRILGFDNHSPDFGISNTLATTEICANEEMCQCTLIIWHRSRRKAEDVKGLGKTGTERSAHKDVQTEPGLRPQESQRCSSAQKAEIVIAASLLHRLLAVELDWMGTQLTGVV